MAKLSSDGKYVTVEKGDTLSEIAEKYAGGASKYKQLQTINKISNANLIYVGQKIYLTGTGSSSSSSNTSSNMATILSIGVQANSENLLVATWEWAKHNETKEYQIIWKYATGDGIGFIGKEDKVTFEKGTQDVLHTTWGDYPKNATKVMFWIKPIATTKKVGDKDVERWTAKWNNKEYKLSENPPVKAPTPSIKLEGYKLTASVDGVDDKTKTIEFQVVQNNSKTIATKSVSVKTGHAEHTFTVPAGGEYKVRCRGVKNGEYGEWSDYSGNESSAPSAPTGFKTPKALSKTAVQLEWTPVSNADSYDVEYTTKKIYFDSSTEVESKNFGKECEGTVQITGLDLGEEYFFRVRAVKGTEKSGWTSIKSIIIGTKPSPPTTWSSTTTAIVGEEVVLYWNHNSDDNSKQVQADLTLFVNGIKQNIPVIKNTTNEDEKNKTSSCVINTRTNTISWTVDGKTTTQSLSVSITEGAVIKWRVATCGITMEYSDPSVERTIDVYAPPTVDLDVTDSSGNDLRTLTSFPFYIKALAGPSTQLPIGYHVNIISNEIYETVDAIGNPKYVNVGESVYSQFYDISGQLLLELSAGSVDLQNGVRYTLICTASMDSGLTGESSIEFTVEWTDETFLPNAEIGIDPETYSATIRPYCETHTRTYYKVELVDGIYTKTNETLGYVYGEVVEGAQFLTGETLYKGATADGDEVYFCVVDDAQLVEDVTLAVYRREFDGSFTEIAKDLNNTDATYITDPHPALDYARYRIVATTKTTGAVSYYDIPNYPVGGIAVIIQWDEEWSNFAATDSEDALDQPPWSGSMLKLPYNIDVSDKNAIDVALIEYTGRKRPVTYYGTQLGETATWNTEIPKYDKETLYALRRLAIYTGDVYVREPSGSGYWANISVSFSQKHLGVTIPVTLELTRVEGGM